MDLNISPKLELTEMRRTDETACVEYLAEREIYERTLRIPYPYTAGDFACWMDLCEKTTAEQGELVNWAIRGTDGRLIGAAGFDGLQRGHRAELGYWLAKPYWGRGIMTAVVHRLCQHAFDHWGLVRITAHVFAFNQASARVLEKNGFTLEGHLRKHYLKDSQFVDSKLYALVR